MPEHKKFMQRALDLARLGAGYVSPNPMVGAVIMHQDRIIGEGFHQNYGSPHAEVNAIQQVLQQYPEAEQLLKEATLYVTLEPCAHFGKTPPCSDLIIQHQIPKVVVGCRDPFPQVNGKGIEKLKAAKIKVIENILEQECLELNKRFFTKVRQQRPYIILKWAQTRDGFFAKEGEQFWITSPLAQKLVHKWRSEEDAILIGKRTAAIDNPQLNVRHWSGRNPKRMVIDKELRLDKTLHLFDQSQETIVFNVQKTERDGKVHYIQLEDFEHFLPQMILYQLYMLDVQSLIIEGGAFTLQQFIQAGLWDEARIFTGPMEIDSGIPAPHVIGKLVSENVIGPDRLSVWQNKTTYAL